VRFRGGFIAATVCSESRQVGAVALGKQSRFAARSVGGRAFRVDEIPTNVGTSGEREFEGRSRATFAGGEIRSMSKNTEKPAVRITNQFRKGDSMVYDLSCKDVLLTLAVMPTAPELGTSKRSRATFRRGRSWTSRGRRRARRYAPSRIPGLPSVERTDSRRSTGTRSLRHWPWSERSDPVSLATVKAPLADSLRRS
jgi:hypothetical protein